MSALAESAATGRLRPRVGIRVRGIVQGVGYRPFVYRLAGELGLDGWVRNDGAGVCIEAQGDRGALTLFAGRLRSEAPPGARVDEVAVEPLAPDARARGFSILGSQGGAISTAIGPDLATCPDCLAELFSPASRRWRYPFINCTHCGPRYTITRRLPYDRANTSMAAFHLCRACELEYHAPRDRRFHAEPNACPVCGPKLTVLDSVGHALTVEDPVAHAVARLLAGEIVAIKGLGGFHLACDATNPGAVARLRRRKHREEKPFALMVHGLTAARRWADLGQAESELLASPERPVVLARKRAEADQVMPAVAPGLNWLGLMLPYTPLHYLLFHEAVGRPSGTAWLERSQGLTLVLTSANPGGEPLVIGNAEAVRRLGGIADTYLVHDREIVARCDDSVLRTPEGRGAAPQFIRRARGYTPRAIRLAGPGPSVLALGGQLKNTVCVTRGDEAFLSPHVGDLDNGATCEAMLEAADHLCRILDVQPERVAHDLHPDFFSSRSALQQAARLDATLVAVQHHHAHVAAVLAEHRHDGPALGLALDGFGLGMDGHAWGGELLLWSEGRMQRLGHLRELPQPGGDKAAREPWRMAAAALHVMGRGARIEARFPAQPAAHMVGRMLERGIQCGPTSSLGRWFDAAAGLLGVREVMAFEGQAAMLLEGLVARRGEALPLPGGWRCLPDGSLDLLPLLERLTDERDAARGSALFHATLVAALEQWVTEAARRAGLRTVALGGGCFLNHVLSRNLVRRLAVHGLTVLEARQVPPNDGGLALGQAWMARQLVLESKE